MKKILVIGSLNMDYAIDVLKPPAPGETILAKSLDLIPGGKGANQAYTLGRLGADVKMLGAVGDDGNGERILKSLNDVGVDTSDILVDGNQPTGIAIIYISSSGENQIVVAPGANSSVTKEYIDKNVESIKAADIIMVQLEIPMGTVEYIVELANNLGKIIIFDPAPIQGSLDEDIVKKINYIKPNSTELSYLTGINVNKSNYKEAAKKLQNLGIGVVLATLGEGGVYAYDGKNEYEVEAVKVDVVDTTAAGDSFLATFAYYLSKDVGIKEAIVRANKFAAMVVSKKGAQASIPSLKEFEEYSKKSLPL